MIPCPVNVENAHGHWNNREQERGDELEVRRRTWAVTWPPLLPHHWEGVVVKGWNTQWTMGMSDDTSLLRQGYIHLWCINRINNIETPMKELNLPMWKQDQDVVNKVRGGCAPGTAGISIPLTIYWYLDTLALSMFNNAGGRPREPFCVNEIVSSHLYLQFIIQDMMDIGKPHCTLSEALLALSYKAATEVGLLWLRYIRLCAHVFADLAISPQKTSWSVIGCVGHVLFRYWWNQRVIKCIQQPAQLKYSHACIYTLCSMGARTSTSHPGLVTVLFSQTRW